VNKRLSFLSVFEIKPFELFCILFTINVIIVTISSFIVEILIPFERVILDIIMFCGIPVLALMILGVESVSKRIDNMKNGMVIGLLLHFIMTIVLVVLSCFLLMLIAPLPDEFSLGAGIWNAVFSMVQSYVIVLLCAKIIDVHKTAQANKSLKIIQDSLKNIQNGGI